ncbi:LuxR C-terminal-related transcriptional regulator [Chitinimonas lacunae]|uniref:LuxR C-terminal-related transcriptional regulator n=1 Tax=Chitinimonas lacunae TaxID=1963018 RepID=A0ABV8MVJ9_9NEIS
MSPLDHIFSNVLQVQTEDDLRKEMVAFAKRIGFDYVTILCAVGQVNGEHKQFALNNYPETWDANNPENLKRDPIVAKLKSLRARPTPVLWGPELYQATDTMDLWESASAHGFHSGIATPILTTPHKRVLVGLSRDKALDNDLRVVQHQVGELCLFTSFAQLVVDRIFDLDRLIPSLTRRELECLQWTVEGKTAGEVAIILSMSERTANFHLQNAMKKLGAANKYQAAMRAAQYGLL